MPPKTQNIYTFVVNSICDFFACGHLRILCIFVINKTVGESQRDSIVTVCSPAVMKPVSVSDFLVTGVSSGLFASTWIALGVALVCFPWTYLEAEFLSSSSSMLSMEMQFIMAWGGASWPLGKVWYGAPPLCRELAVFLVSLLFWKMTTHSGATETWLFHE